MAQLQYIGARYVPTWYKNSIDDTSNWEINVEYEALTYVTTPNNHLYLSKKTVPDNIGTPAQNTEYWLDMGTFSGSYSDLQDEIDEINDVKLPEIASDISEISTNLAKLARNDKNRKYLFLGDSYYLGGTGTTYTGIGWASQIINCLGLSSSQYILADASEILLNGSISTPGFYPSTTTHKSFADILRDISSRLTQEERESITDVLVCGGYNDKDNDSDIFTGIEDYATVAKTNYPNARFWCAHIGYSLDAADRLKLVATRNEYRRCIECGITYIGDAEFVLVDNAVFLNTAHPGASGYKLIGKALANVLVGGNEAFTPIYPIVTGSVNDSQVSSQAGALVVNLNKYGLKWLANNLTMVFASNFAFSQNNKINVKLDCRAIQPTPNLVVSGRAEITTRNSPYYYWEDVIITYYQQGNDLYMQVEPASALKNFVDTYKVQIFRNNFEIPAYMA